VLPVIAAVHLDASLFDQPHLFNPWRWQQVSVSSSLFFLFLLVLLDQLSVLSLLPLPSSPKEHFKKISSVRNWQNCYSQAV